MRGDNEGRSVPPETDGDSVASESTTKQTTSSQLTHSEGFIPSPTLTGASHSKNACERKPFLVAGQGWTRYVASLKEGRRYVPKGGHVVDFSALDEKESEQSKMKSVQNSQPRRLIMTSTKSVNRPPAYCHHDYSSKADERRRSEDSQPNDSSFDPYSSIALDLLKGSELWNTPSPAENSPPGRHPAVLHSPPRPPTVTAPSATVHLPQWKPAGKLGQSSFFSPLSGRRPMEGLHRLKTPEAKDSAYERTQLSQKIQKNANRNIRFRCQDCKNLAKSREELAQQKTSIRQERTALIQMRRRIESDQSKLTKDKQEFETYKASELDRLHSTASKLCWRLQRDAMAFEARQREFLVKVQSESSNANPGSSKEEEARGEEVKHLMSKMEAERNEFRNREGQLKQKISDLEGQLLAFRLHNKNRHVIEETDKKPEKYCVTGEEHGGERVRGEEGSVDPVLGHLARRGLPDSLCPSPADLSGEFQIVNDNLEGELQTWESVCESSYVSSPDTQSLEMMMVVSPALSSSIGGSSNETPVDSHYSRSSLAPQKENTKAFAPTVRCFENGSVCKQWLDGHSMTTYINGDLKQTFPSGITEYYYASAQVWQVSHPSNIEVYYFPSGRVEAHHPGGDQKEVLLFHVDTIGAYKVVGGVEEPVLPSLLCAEVLFPRPQPLNKT
jgi:hypothetical protein